MEKTFKPKIVIFHCINAFGDGAALSFSETKGAQIESVKMACSSMVKDVFLLRAFESGADAVVVLVCPEGFCRYVEGNIRAKKRVEWIKDLLDEIGLNGQRLSLFNIPQGDQEAAAEIIQQTLKDLEILGPNPAA
ncbi:hydrogenase iron-sulfur subunit [Thermodesulfobacteriota bacterium]